MAVSYTHLDVYKRQVLGMSSVFIGTVMMAARIFDAFNDPVMGLSLIHILYSHTVIYVSGNGNL